MKKIPHQMTDNEELCDSEIIKLQKHCDEIMTRLTDIREHHEQTLRNDLVKKNDQLNHMKSELEKKKREIVDTVEFMEENNSTMSDYSLIDNHGELTKMLSELEVLMTKCEHSERFIRGEINNHDFLDSVVGRTLDLDNISVSIWRWSNLHFGDYQRRPMLHIYEFNSNYIEKVNQQGVKESIFSFSPNDMCVTDTGDVYFTNYRKKSISCLSSSGSVCLSRFISTDPLIPMGICQSMDGGLLVTLRDNAPDFYKLESHSRRLARHITVTGDIIHEYEYQEDGQTRLFTLPYSVTEKINGDICVVNRTSLTTGELVIMSPCGRMKSVYSGQNLTYNFNPTDIACDSLCNILVPDLNNKQIHILSPDGEFLKFLLTDNEVNRPNSLSLYKSTLWVGYSGGCVTVFQYTM